MRRRAGGHRCGGSRARGLPAALILLLLLAHGAVAVGDADSRTLEGDVHLDEDLIVAAGDALAVAPGARITGDAHILVLGAFLVNGTVDAPVTVHVPVLVLGDGTARVQHAAFTGTRGFAFLAAGGNVTLGNVTFHGGDVAVKHAVTRGNVTVSVTDAVFGNATRAGVAAAGTGAVDVTRAAFHGNAIGVAATYHGERGPTLTVSGSTFLGNDVAARVAWHAPEAGDARGHGGRLAGAAFTGNVFEGRAGAAEDTTGVLVVADGGDDAASSVPLVSRGNVYRGHGHGVDLDGAPGSRVTFTSTRDVFEANDVGVHARDVDVVLRNPEFVENAAWDVLVPADADPDRVRVTGASTARVATGVPPDAGTPGLMVVAGLAAVVAVAGVVVARQVTRPRLPARVAPSASTGNPEPVTPEAETPPRVSGLERDVLRDVHLNPGTSQSALAARLGISRQAVHYHVKKLVGRGLLRKESRGRVTRLHATEAAVAANRE